MQVVAQLREKPEDEESTLCVGYLFSPASYFPAKRTARNPQHPLRTDATPV